MPIAPRTNVAFVDGVLHSALDLQQSFFKFVSIVHSRLVDRLSVVIYNIYVKLQLLSALSQDFDEFTRWRRGVVVSGVGLINEVNRHWAHLVLGWVTVCGRVNHLGMYPVT